VLDPAGLAISPDGTRLLVADAGEARIQEYLLASGRLKTFLDGSPLREPRGVQIDRRGHVWVADSWSRAILEFSPRGELLHRYAPPR
jgi:sugar lactone lactonase YvrE